MNIESYNSERPTLEGMDVLGSLQIRLYRISIGILKDPLNSHSRKVRKSAQKILRGLSDLGQRLDLVFTHAPRVWSAVGLETQIGRYFVQ